MMSDIEKKGAHETIMDMFDVHPVTTANQVGDVGDLHEAVTRRTLKNRHAQMIAIGGTISTGLFVESGQAWSMSDPLFLILSYVIISIMVYRVVTATIEMSSYLPVRGCSMSYFGKRFFSSNMGSAPSWSVPTETNKHH
jgi:amino acid transporter